MKRIAALAIAGLIATACTSGPTDRPTVSSPKQTFVPPTSPAPADYQFPTRYAGDFTVVWSAEPGIDLLSRPAEVVRATFEAQSITRVPSVINYPGAIAATADANRRRPTLQIGYQERPDPSIPPTSGTQYFHVLRMESSANTISAIVCDIRAGLVNHPIGGIDSSLVSFLASFDATLPAGSVDRRAHAPVHGTPAGEGDRAPRYDAFAPWQVNYEYSLPVPGTSPEDKTFCYQKSREIARTIPAYANRTFGTYDDPEPRGLTPADFPKQPQFPGWPAP